MKKLFAASLVLLAVSLAAPTRAGAQSSVKVPEDLGTYRPQPAVTVTMNMNGVVSADRRTFSTDDGQTFNVMNPRALRRYAGMHITVRGTQLGNSDNLKIESVHSFTGKQSKSAARTPDESVQLKGTDRP